MWPNNAATEVGVPIEMPTTTNEGGHTGPPVQIHCSNADPPTTSVRLPPPTLREGRGGAVVPVPCPLAPGPYSFRYRITVRIMVSMP
jgi:hypothetical protein